MRFCKNISIAKTCYQKYREKNVNNYETVKAFICRNISQNRYPAIIYNPYKFRHLNTLLDDMINRITNFKIDGLLLIAITVLGFTISDPSPRQESIPKIEMKTRPYTSVNTKPDSQ